MARMELDRKNEAGDLIHFNVYETGGHGMKDHEWFEHAAQ